MVHKTIPWWGSRLEQSDDKINEHKHISWEGKCICVYNFIWAKHSADPLITDNYCRPTCVVFCHAPACSLRCLNQDNYSHLSLCCSQAIKPTSRHLLPLCLCQHLFLGFTQTHLPHLSLPSQTSQHFYLRACWSDFLALLTATVPVACSLPIPRQPDSVPPTSLWHFGDWRIVAFNFEVCQLCSTSVKAGLN